MAEIERIKDVTNPMIIYHGGGCLDGFASALAAHYHFAEKQGLDIEYFAAQHSEAPPEVDERDVFMLDFCYNKKIMQELCGKAKRIVVLDHHISAFRETLGLDDEIENLELHFDMKRSGAVISWEFFNRKPLPLLYRHIEDRDLWRWEHPDSLDVTAALASYPFDFSLWDIWVRYEEVLERLRDEGRAINRYRQQEINVYKKRAILGKVAGFVVPVVNCPTGVVSECLGELAKGKPFAAGYIDKPHKRAWSLRSTPEGEDVAEIALRLGGGGHARAAGFTTPLSASVRVVEVPPESET